MLEIEPEEISFYYILALQLGTSLRFLEANIKQKNIVTGCGKRMKY